MKQKRGRGRPKLDVDRYSALVTKDEHSFLKELGNGFFSKGVREAVRILKDAK